MNFLCMILLLDGEMNSGERQSGMESVRGTRDFHFPLGASEEEIKWEIFDQRPRAQREKKSSRGGGGTSWCKKLQVGTCLSV